MKKLIALSILALSQLVSAEDWQGASAPIEVMYVYDNAVIVVQGNTYTGEANCKSDQKWGFYWNDFSEEMRARVHSMLLAAYMSKSKIKPLSDSSTCGPEGSKKFNGKIIFY